jgi:tetratricopeptide (TPR) repeat protein
MAWLPVQRYNPATLLRVSFMRRLIPGCLLLLLSVVAPLVASDQQWLEVRSQHFTLITDAGEKRGREVLTRFEQMRASFGVIFNRANAKVSLPVPLEIVAFRNSKEMREFAPIFNKKPVELAGYFLSGEDRNFIAIDLSTESSWEVVFHEYAHLIINGNLPPLPLWFDEGFADFCSSFKVEGKQVRIGEPLPGRVQSLLDNRWMHLTDLFSVQHGSREYNEGDRRSVFYAESWLMVHYLIVRQQIDKVIQYMRLVQNEHMPVPDAIQRAFGMDAAHLEAVLRKYFDGESKYFYAAAPPDMDGAPFSSRPLTPAESLARLADMHFHERDHHEQALGEFKQVLQQDPNNVTANRVLGEAALRQGDYNAAREYLNRAAAQGSTDARVYYYAAMLHQRDDRGEGTGEHVSEMTKLLQKSLELDPNFAQAYNLLAIVRMQQRDHEGAVQAVTRAIQLDPRNDIYRMNLAGYFMQARQFEKAAPLLADLVNSSHSGVAQEAGAMQRAIAEMQAAQGRGGVKRNADDADAEDAGTDSAVSPVRAASVSGPIPQLGRRTTSKDAATDAAAPIPIPPGAPITFVKGTLVQVSCDSAPAATLSLSVSGKPALTLRVNDVNHVVLIGADKFSCDWRNQKVAVNYRAGTDGQLTVVSLELQ